MYAWGFRNPYGLAVGPDNALYVTMHGFDARGSRPIENAPDCFYKVDENAWYGWPDFACDVAVTDARFKPKDKPQPEPEQKGEIEFGDLCVDIARHQVMVKNKQIDLTATEFKLLWLLAERRGRVQSREQLLCDVWEYNSLVDTRTVDTHMRRLREKLGSASRFLETVRGVGYRFVDA